jgi:hypothetical protein
VAGSVLVHLLFLIAAVLSLPHKGPPPEPQRFLITLIHLRPSRPHKEAPTAAHAKGAAAPSSQSIIIPNASPIVAPQAPSETPATGEDQDRAKLAGLLRGSFGCSEARFLDLSQEEQDRCEKLRRSRVASAGELPVFVAPEKRAGFEASLAARQAPSHPPGFVCGVLIDGLHLKIPKTPPHSLKLGPAPCYVVPPKFVLSEEADVEMPSKQASDGDSLYFKPRQLLKRGKMAPGMGQPPIDLGNIPGR